PTNDVHDLHMEVSKVATCAEAGEGKNTCSRCDHNEAVTLEKLGHSYTKKSEIPGSCTSKGMKQMVCDHCGKEQWYETTTDPDGHSWINTGVCMECVWCHEEQPGSRNPYWKSDTDLFGTTNQKKDEPLFPGVQWAPPFGGDPNDFPGCTPEETEKGPPTAVLFAW
ncbi:MAG: hypothetical protein IJZ56_03650, partial [Oscillospiraceae bacterium]|nr:hypothetical protein [Oscillospiraceae bacterium]